MSKRYANIFASILMMILNLSPAHARPKHSHESEQQEFYRLNEQAYNHESKVFFAQQAARAQASAEPYLALFAQENGVRVSAMKGNRYEGYTFHTSAGQLCQLFVESSHNYRDFSHYEGKCAYGTTAQVNCTNGRNTSQWRRESPERMAFSESDCAPHTSFDN